MASGGLENWNILCPICNTCIAVKDNDAQSSLDYHFLKVHQKQRQSIPSPYPSEIKNELGKAASKYIKCPVCNDDIEVLNWSINRTFRHHFKNNHRTTIKSESEDHLCNFQKRTDVQEPGKNYDSVKSCPEKNNFQLAAFHDLPKNLKNHSGFIIYSGNKFGCRVCSMTLDSVIIVKNHLKTKNHEDNIILDLKNKLPSHLENTMKFISFYDSALCCNLCRSKIELNSDNIYQSIINIVAHNADATHCKNKSYGDPTNDNIGVSILKSIAKKNPLINENMHLITTELEPNFKCKLCEKLIVYSKNNQVLIQNFCSHIESSLHIKSLSAMSFLQWFTNAQCFGQDHGFVISKGFIVCVHCKSVIEANSQELFTHMEHHLNPDPPRLGANPSHLSHSDANQISLNNNFCSAPSFSYKPQPGDTPKNYRNTTAGVRLGTSYEAGSSNDRKQAKSRDTNTKQLKKKSLQEIIKPLYNKFGNITCIAENGENSLTCLICNCSLQFTTHGVKMHIKGEYHKKKTSCQIRELNNLNINP